MQKGDRKFKKNKSAKSAYWRNFIVPDLAFYESVITQMDADYLANGSKCPCCGHPVLEFLENSGVWQASKDRMKHGLAYGDKYQVNRWCCTCCNKFVYLI